MPMLLQILVLAALSASGRDARAPHPPWGFTGHEMAARAAVAALPDQVPSFFREAGPQLAYLNPEPDRWRNPDAREMDQAFAYDHYIDLENLPERALEAPDRFAFLRILYDAGLEQPERDAGFLPYRIVELYQRLVSGWGRWRSEDDPVRRAWIEERIVNDAGVLGHYVTDGSQPHHTTIHFNGWNANTPNPQGYTRDNGFHARFERYFVEAHVTPDDVQRYMRQGSPHSVAGAAREAVIAYIRATHEHVETLYRIDRDEGFESDRPAPSSAREFAAQRLAAGADMLAVLWVSAWIESAPETDRPEPTGAASAPGHDPAGP